MKKRILAFDVDGVLADFIGQFCIWYNHMHKDDGYKASREDFPTYDISGWLIPHKQCIWNFAGFIETMPVMPGALRVFPEIYKHYETIVVTACPDDKHEERIRWFKTFFPEFDTRKIVFAQDKGLVNFDVLFDDCPENCDAAGKERAVIFSHPHNEDYSGACHRVSSWDDIWKWVVENCEPIDKS